MKRPENHKVLLLLMLISQIMLTGLVIQWLRTQWLEEKESLRREVNNQFTEAVGQVMDSMLYKHLIIPALNDTLGPRKKIIKFDKKLVSGHNNPGQHVTAFINQSDNTNATMITIALSDSAGKKDNNSSATLYNDSSGKSLLLRSAKLIIRQTSDSIRKDLQISHFGSLVPDTTLLKKLFNEKLHKSGNKFEIRWISGSDDKLRSKRRSSIYFESNLLDSQFGAIIGDYRKIVLKGITPQILFAFILLSVTCSAFFFTYRSLKKMRVLNNLRNDFISNISHELKTPVSTVSVALEALKNFDIRKDNDKTAEYLDIARIEMKRLDMLITRVLNTSLLEDQSQYLQIEEADLVKLLNEVLSSMQFRFLQHNAKVKFEDNRKEVLLNLDRLHIQGVIINLLDNSLKYGTADPQISIRIEEKPTTVLLSVSDNGPGIPDEYLTKVFDKFFRVPEGDRHNVKGYGLGLNFAYLVMKQHSGAIDVRNLPAGGCEFILTFPKPKS